MTYAVPYLRYIRVDPHDHTGSGKTVLATALVRDEKVYNSFSRILVWPTQRHQTDNVLIFRFNCFKFAVGESRYGEHGRVVAVYLAGAAG
jgi:hypothetical protein